MSTSLHLMVADDYTLIRQGLALMIGSIPEFLLIGEASNGQQVIDQLPFLQVDVVLMDIQMPVLDGICTTKHITQHFPKVKVLGMSSDEGPWYQRDMINAGALGCIPKTVPIFVLTEAVKTVAQGQAFVFCEG